MRLIISLILTILSFGGHTQTFNKRLSFDSNSLETGKSCIEVDNHYLFFGAYFDSTGTPRTGSKCLDIDGNEINSKKFYEDSTVFIIDYYSGISTFNDSIVGTGVFSIPPYDLFTGMLVVFDSFGDTIFTKVIQPEPNELILPGKALKVEDGFVVCGQFAFPDSISGGGFLMKFDLSGNLLWRKNYLPVADDAPIRLVSAVQLPNGGFLLGGATMYAFNWNHLVIKTDSLGVQIWRKTEGDEYSNTFAMVANTADGKYIFAGEDQNAEQNQDRSQVTKLDNNNSVLWTHYYGEIGPDCLAFSIKSLTDGGFVFCGSDRSFGGLYGYICRIDSEGNQLWYRKYRQTEGNECFATDVSPTSDGGFIMTGLLQPDNQLDLAQDMWAIKLDSMGCLVPGCHLIDVAENEMAAMSIYPNPADDFINVYVETKQVTDCALHLFDLQGREISCTTVRENSNTWMMDSSSLAAGTYVLQLLVDGVVVKSEKVVVRH